MKYAVSACMLSVLFSMSAPHAGASPDVYRSSPSPAELCATELGRHSEATLRLQRLCDAGAKQSDLTLSGRAAAHANAGTVRIRRGDLEGAARLLSEAHAMRGASADIAISLSAVLIRMERYDEAVLALADLDQVSEELRAKALYNRATAELQRNNVEAAFVDLRETVQLAPDFGPAQDMLKRFNVTPHALTADAQDSTRNGQP